MGTVTIYYAPASMYSVQVYIMIITFATWAGTIDSEPWQCDYDHDFYS